jgi:hypothetical protein
MGDHTTETFQQLQSRLSMVRNILDLVLDEDSISWILNQIDCFVSQSQGNIIVKVVHLRPQAFSGENYKVWEKLGQAIHSLSPLFHSKLSTVGKYPNADTTTRYVMRKCSSVHRYFSYCSTSLRAIVARPKLTGT